MVIAVFAVALALPMLNANAGPPRALFIKLPTDTPEPRVTLDIARDPTGTWVLVIDAQNFQFTDICRIARTPATIGHAHVIKDGKKIAKATGPRVELGELEPGTHRFSVELRAQDHRAFVGAEGMIATAITATIPSA